jgi:uncharacterized phage protein gp47/JayE
MISLAQLLVPVTEDQATETLLQYLAGQGYQATSWQDGSIQKTLVKGFGKLYSVISGVVSDLAAAGYPRLAKGLYQDALGQYFYSLDRVPATATIGTMTLTLSSAAAPAAWSASDLVIADAPQAPANSFRILDPGALGPGASGTFSLVCETPGAAGNIPPNVPLYFWTPITGLSATNPALVGTSTWVTTPGTDEESPTRYADRMVGRWSRLSYSNTEGAYKAWALEALPSLTRVTVGNGANPGEVLITGATALGGLDPGQITTITDYINGVPDNIGRRPINDFPIVQSATAVSFPTLNLTVTCDSQFAATCGIRTINALLSLFGSLPIGGEKISPNPLGYVLQSRMYQTIMALQGARNVTGIPTDILLSPTDIYTPGIVVTVVST